MSCASPALTPRLKIQSLLDSDALVEGMRTDVISGLQQTPKSLPAYLFYDDHGSDLFEQICGLPEYYPTRTEAALFETYGEEIVRLTGACELVELGSGSSRKTQLLLDAYEAADHPLRYVPIDISGGMLEQSARGLLERYPALNVHALASTYDRGIENLPPKFLERRAIAFIGSSIGNLSLEEYQQFLNRISTALNPGDYFLLGVDLHKDRDVLEAAYNDSQGVTAAFNLNMLTHLNQRFGGDFQVDQFEHVAFYNDEARQIEMHLQSRQQQSVYLADLELSLAFGAGERMMTEISRKFELERLQTDLQGVGLIPAQMWTDEQDWFGLVLAQKSAA